MIRRRFADRLRMAKEMLELNGVVNIYELAAAQGISVNYARQIVNVLKTVMRDQVELRGESLYMDLTQKQINLDDRRLYIEK